MSTAEALLVEIPEAQSPGIEPAGALHARGLPEIYPGNLRSVLGNHASGTTIVTNMDGGEPLGFTCQSFFSVLMELPLVSCGVMATSTTYPRVRRAGVFGINILADDQDHIWGQFAQRGADKWAGTAWTETPAGMPEITGAFAAMECELWAEHAAGDLLTVAGRVSSVKTDAEDSPLLYWQAAYR